jgi:CRISPR system Cascade subunit CasE
MAFPSDPKSDPHFLKPFNPEKFDGKRVHGVERSADSGFLFRIEPQPGGRVVIVVQSAVKPNWHYAFQNAGHLLRDPLAALPHVEEFDPCYAKDRPLRFRIRVNLSKKMKTSAAGVDLTTKREGVDKHGRPRAQSKRVALTWDKDQNRDDVIREWFSKKGIDNGFNVQTVRTLQVGWGAGIDPDRKDADHKSGSGDGRMKFRSALLEGTLTVGDANSFRDAIINGIGSGKAFGFGLLSVAP